MANGNANVIYAERPNKYYSISIYDHQMNRVISTSLLLLIASANADYGLFSSFGDPKTVEQKEGVSVIDSRELQELRERALVGAEFVLFSSCKGLKASVCKKIINRAHRMAPYKFGNSARVEYKMERVRDPPPDKTDPAFHPDNLLLIADYWLVGIRTDFEDLFVAGVDGEGLVEYIYPWCTADETELGYTCYELGPWDCSGGLTWTECCDYAKASVTDRGISLTDLHGNMLDCYDSPPPISEADPVNYGRVKLHIDKGSTVVKAPKNG